MLCHISAYSGTSGNKKMRYLMVSARKRMYYLCEVEIEKSIFRDPWDRFFYHSLTLMLDSYIASPLITILCQDLVLKSTSSNIEIISLTISRSNCFGYSKELSPCDSSFKYSQLFKYPQHKFPL